MDKFRALYRKELSAIFFSPMAYTLIAIFLMLMGYTFCAQLFHTRGPSLTAMLYQAAVLLLLIVPLITMRQFAEERRSRTLELLLSAPVNDFAIVTAKFFASLSVVTVMLVCMLSFPLALSYFASPDWGPIVSGYLGLMLLGAALVSMGLAISAFATNQLVAAIMSLGLFLLMWMVETLGVLLPAPIDQLALGLSLDNRLAPFATGALYLSDFGYFLILCLIGLGCAVAGLARR